MNEPTMHQHLIRIEEEEGSVYGFDKFYDRLVVAVRDISHGEFVRDEYSSKANFNCIKGKCQRCKLSAILGMEESK